MIDVRAKPAENRGEQDVAESSRIVESSGNREIAVSDGTPASTRRRSRESRSEEQRSLGRSSSAASQFGAQSATSAVQEMSRESGDRERGESVRARRAEQMRARAAAAEQARGLQRVSQIEPECRETRYSRDGGVLRTPQLYLAQPKVYCSRGSTPRVVNVLYMHYV